MMDQSCPGCYGLIERVFGIVDICADRQTDMSVWVPCTPCDTPLASRQ